MNENVTIIKPRKGWQFVDIKELIAYRDLLRFLVIRGIKAKYAQSVLGIGWAIIQPLFTTLLLTVVFGSLAKVDSNGMPYIIFSAAAVIPWTYFSNSMNEASTSLTTNANLITKVYFPRLILPLSIVITKLLDFIIAFIVLLIVTISQGFYPNINYLYIPLLILISMLSAAGIGMWLSSLAVQYRDINYAMTFLMQLLMYAAPVVYSTYALPQKYQLLYAINPMVGVIESYRAIFSGLTPIPYNFLLVGSISALIVFVTGVLYFKRMEKNFADVA